MKHLNDSQTVPEAAPNHASETLLRLWIGPMMLEKIERDPAALVDVTISRPGADCLTTVHKRGRYAGIAT